MGNFGKVHKFWKFGTMEALINEYRLEIIEHCWKYSNSHSSFIIWILKFRKFLILAPAPSIFSGVSRKGRKVCHSFKCFKIGVLHIRSWSTFSIFLISEMAGVTMTLFCTHGRVSGPNSLLDNEVIAPCGYSVPCQFWPVVRRHGRGVLWAGAILAWRGVSSARLQAQSSRKVGVRPLLMEPGTRLRHSWAAVTDHDVYAF